MKDDCSKIRPEFLSIMLDKIKNIRKLELSSLDIDDAFLNNLGLNLHKLVYINLSMCGKITDEGLICLVEKIPSLLKVDFQNTAITNRMRQKIVHTLNSRRLYNVTLDWYKKLNQHDLIQFRNCVFKPNLKISTMYLVFHEKFYKP